MAFTTVPYSGKLVLNANDISWCSVSPTKAFLIYSGWTEGLNAGQRKLIIQAVYFNGKNPATFGPACSVGIIAGTWNTMPQIASLTDGRLFVTMRESNLTFSYSVFNVEAGDLVSLSYKHGTLFTNLGAQCPVAVEALTANKVLAAQTANASNTYQLITVGESELTITIVGGATVLTAHTNNGQTGTAIQLTGHSIKRDLDGNILVARSFIGNTVSSLDTNGIALTKFDKDGTPLYYGNLSAVMAGGVDVNGTQKGKDLLPITATHVLALGAKTGALGYGGAVTGENTFTRLTLSASNGASGSAGDSIAYRDATVAMFVDAIWLDDDYFFAMAFNRCPDGQVGIRAPAQWDSLFRKASPQVAYIGKYNKDSNSLVMADSMPLALPGTQSYATSQTKFLHRISNTEVAIIQPTYTDDSGVSAAQYYEINVTVIGA